MARSDSQKLYDAFAPYYHQYASRRAKYISSVNNIIIDVCKSKKASLTMLDVGSGDGARAEFLSSSMGATSLVMSDNSEKMLEIMQDRSAKSCFFDISGDSLIDDLADRHFGVITCLWNVFGHIPNEVLRQKSLLNVKNLLCDGGLSFLDVNNRYNIKSYGIKIVLKNIFLDYFVPMKIDRGDARTSISVGYDLKIPEVCHYFHPLELEKLIRECGLKIHKKLYVNYNNGSIEKTCFGGQILYVLKKEDGKS